MSIAMVKTLNRRDDDICPVGAQHGLPKWLLKLDVEPGGVYA